MSKKISKLAPTILIILTAALVGLMNTVFIRPEEVGTWRNYVGYLFLLIAMIGSVMLIIKLRKTKG